MNLISKIQKKFNTSGFQGVIATGLHYTANLIDPSLISSLPQVEPNSEFLRWVRWGVPGMLTSTNIDAMDHAIRNMPSEKPILEIGTFSGLSTVVIAYLLEKYSKNIPIFTCDIWTFQGSKKGGGLGDSQFVTHDGYAKYVKDNFFSTSKTFLSHKLPHTLECSSDEFFRRWFAHEEAVDVFERSVTLGGEIGFCYIDGSHDYEVVSRDFENTDRALSSGGFILFDDSADDSPHEINRLTRMIASGNRYELISKNPNYFFRKR